MPWAFTETYQFDAFGMSKFAGGSRLWPPKSAGPSAAILHSAVECKFRNPGGWSYAWRARTLVPHSYLTGLTRHRDPPFFGSRHASGRFARSSCELEPQLGSLRGQNSLTKGSLSNIWRRSCAELAPRRSRQRVVPVAFVCASNPTPQTEGRQARRSVRKR